MIYFWDIKIVYIFPVEKLITKNMLMDLVYTWFRHISISYLYLKVSKALWVICHMAKFPAIPALCAGASLDTHFIHSHRDLYCKDRCHCDTDVTSLISEYTIAFNGNPLLTVWKEINIHYFCPLINTGIPRLSNISTIKTLQTGTILNHF